MSNTIRTRKAPALIEDTGITWSVQAGRLAKAAAVAVVFSALAACGVQNDAASLSDMAAFQEMSVPAWNTKEDCDAAAAVAGKSLDGGSQELTFSCDTVDTAKLEKAADMNAVPPVNTGEPTSTANTLAAAPAGAASAPATHHAGGGSNPLLWYMMGNMMGNRTGMSSSSAFAPSTGAPAPSAFINSAGNGKMTMSAAQQFATPSPAQYAGMKTNGGIIKTGTIGSNLARASSYKASTSSIGSKSSAHSSVGHSSGGHGGGGGGGGG